MMLYYPIIIKNIIYLKYEVKSFLKMNIKVMMIVYFYNSLIKFIILNTGLYPVFKIIIFLKPTDEILKLKSESIIVANVTTGFGQFFQSEIGKFNIIVELENKNENKTDLALCNAHINSQNEVSNLIYNLKYSNAS